MAASLPTPQPSLLLFNQSDQLTDTTRFPISPPPEEEIRSKEIFSPMKQSSVQSLPRVPRSNVPQADPSQMSSLARPQLQSSQNRVESSPNRALNLGKRSRSIQRPLPFADFSNSMGPSTSSAQSPNPKPRKQAKLHPTEISEGVNFKRKDIHITNDIPTETLGGTSSPVKSPLRKKRKDPGLQDYTPLRDPPVLATPCPPSKTKARSRRSMTPDVRYVPPAEEFTPPRAVMKPLVIPSSARSRSQKPPSTTSSKGRRSVEPKVVKVKFERTVSPFPPPRLDLKRLAPPPSPTDDPILLIDDDEVIPVNRRSNRSLVDACVGDDTSISPSVLRPVTPPRTSRTTSPSHPQTFQQDQNGWQFNHNFNDQTALLDVDFEGQTFPDTTFDPGFDSDDDDMVFDTAADQVFNSAQSAAQQGHAFDPNISTGSHIFHSDDEEAEAEAGEAEGEFTGHFKFYKTPLKDDPPDSATRARRHSFGRPISPFPYARRGEIIAEDSDDDEQDSSKSRSPPSPTEGRRKSSTPRPTSVSPLRHQEDTHENDPNDLSNPFMISLQLEGSRTQSQQDANVPPSPYPEAVQQTSPQPQEQNFEDSHDAHSQNVVDDDDDDDDSSDEEPASPGMVQVSSSDPRAAARAAAILKLHHDYIVGASPAKNRRRHSTSFSRQGSVSLDDDDAASDVSQTIRRARRRSLVVSGGIRQSPRSSQSPFSRMSTPSREPFLVVTPEQALKLAETEIRDASLSPSRINTRTSYIRESSFVPPSPSFSELSVVDSSVNRVEWTKDHWKRLDTCFTDERYAVAAAKGLDGMADVTEVDLETVVDRFLGTLSEDEGWDRPLLLRRSTALVARQRVGKGAPPSVKPSLSNNSKSNPFRYINSHSGASLRIPPTLLAPRYNHLLEETSNVRPPAGPSRVASMPPERTSRQHDNSFKLDKDGFKIPATPSRSNATGAQNGSPSVRASATKRALNYLGSFLGRGGNQGGSKAPPIVPFNALPLPHLDMQQVRRGPVTTPSKKPMTKEQPHRGLVNLAHAEIQVHEYPKPKPPKDLVTLNHIDPPNSASRPRTTSGPLLPDRARKNSGGVKDLIKSFEQVSRNAQSDMAKMNTLRRAASVGVLSSKPVWKP
ncbi:hypothetical protein M422DRAFT_784399 [Sphaerobolus stellatus SS14]|uniref:Uncharacterized protein n=1 Tax=Sphaerobolus stellatus (strain SS14) TaxID=990650 RepID=A0A0C9THX7_SPHS4|nr:hypothetical protein M422DRAFT_784399 [Sphaerobolus stellatus SS14]